MSAQGQLPIQLGRGAFFDINSVTATGPLTEERVFTTMSALRDAPHCDACHAEPGEPCATTCETNRC